MPPLGLYSSKRSVHGAVIDRSTEDGAIITLHVIIFSKSGGTSLQFPDNIIGDARDACSVAWTFVGSNVNTVSNYLGKKPRQDLSSLSKASAFFVVDPPDVTVDGFSLGAAAVGAIVAEGWEVDTDPTALVSAAVGLNGATGPISMLVRKAAAAFDRPKNFRSFHGPLLTGQETKKEKEELEEMDGNLFPFWVPSYCMGHSEGTDRPRRWHGPR